MRMLDEVNHFTEPFGKCYVNLVIMLDFVSVIISKSNNFFVKIIIPSNQLPNLNGLKKDMRLDRWQYPSCF
jgi:hypothetical protein